MVMLAFQTVPDWRESFPQSVPRTDWKRSEYKVSILQWNEWNSHYMDHEAKFCIDLVWVPECNTLELAW